MRHPARQPTAGRWQPSRARCSTSTAAGLKNYNDWLIAQLKTGNLDKMAYLTEFNKAFTRSSRAVDYRISADDPTDDVAQAIGNRIVINASGPNARVNVAAGKTLEMIGANGYDSMTFRETAHRRQGRTW
ncbi:hypothetical protein AB1287_06590 [Enterobacter asburiae]|uniref:hypothetical protein n=1 Tax=Scandinavium sp. UTDF21-P1B TaxID=3446379 RepID=UPI00346B4DF3